jgi:tetratricopeptide (TPR) repeat protein
VPATDEARAAVAAEEERFARDGDRPLVGIDLDADEFVVHWIGMWCFGDFGGAYDLLAAEHPSRKGRSRDDYISAHRKWADEAKPASMRLTLVREQEQRGSALWVPGAAGSVAPGGRRELEAFWSVVLGESALGGAIDELPMATVVSKETGRHWFWTGYTLTKVPELGIWTILRSRDEGGACQALTIEELQTRIANAHTAAQKLMQTPPESLRGEQAEEALRQLTSMYTLSMHYHDVLCARLALDEAQYRANLEDARAIRADERAAAILEGMQARFPGKARTFFELGAEYYLVSTQAGETGDIAAQRVWQERAIRALRKAAELEPSAEHLQGLGEVLVETGHYVQAIASYREALRAEPTRASLHSDLADAIMSSVTGDDLDETEAPRPEGDEAERARVERAGREALAELREAQRLDPSLNRLNSRMGSIYTVLNQPDDALLAFNEAIRHDPNDAQARYTLGTLYMDRSDPQRAVRELEAAAELAPLTLAVRIALAACYGVLHRWKDAERELDFIEEVRPGMPQAAQLRAQIATLKRQS